MSTNQQNKEEEVDLGSLFLIIGNGFKKLFAFIWKIFVGLFHFSISILLFLKDNMIKLGIAVLIGGGIGGYFETQKERTFGSDLLLQPNFNSARQLYDNVNYYNDLVAQGEYDLLQSTFKINADEARSIRKFEVYPVQTDNDVVEAFDDLILSIDTTTIKSYSFSQFKRAFTEFDYKVHQVHVEATNNKIFAKLDDVIIASIVENEYYNRLKTITRENLYRTDSLLRENLDQVDSLRRVYMQVMLEEAKKQSPGTKIDMGSNGRKTNELELFQTNRTINRDLQNVSEDISEKSEIINVISNFQPVGYEIGGLRRNNIVIFAGLAFIAMIGIILLLKLNKFLENYKNE
jgi:hypothetical protein